MSQNSPPPHTARILDQERFQNAALASGLNRIAFLAGPYIEIEKSPKKSKKNIASILRYKLYHKLSDEGWIVTLGEYQKLIDATEPLVGTSNNAALAEVSHAKSKDLDAVVMLPSSPGSFLELGAFSSLQVICQKMIIIIDAQFEHDKNYMNSGPVKLAENFGAEIHYCDYSDINCCWLLIEKFITLKLSLKAASRIMSS